MRLGRDVSPETALTHNGHQATSEIQGAVVARARREKPTNLPVERRDVAPPTTTERLQNYTFLDDLAASSLAAILPVRMQSPSPDPRLSLTRFIRHAGPPLDVANGGITPQGRAGATDRRFRVRRYLECSTVCRSVFTGATPF
jgi:hypothetical protein